jgi:hypothetical protein
MSRTWQIVCFAVATACFLAAAVDFNLSWARYGGGGRRVITAVHFIALGLTAFVVVFLVNAIALPS